MIINIVDYLIIIFIIISSGAVLFQQYTIATFFVIFSLIIIKLFKSNIEIKNFNLLKYFIVSLLFNIFVFIHYYLSDGNNSNTYLHLISKLLILLLLPIILDIKNFVEIYKKIMIFLMLTSLIIFISLILNQNIVNNFDIIYGLTGQKYYNLYLYVVPYYNTDHSRNGSLFWEPGAYQCFLTIGAILSINNTKLNRFYLIFYFITIITTNSTSGYVCGLIILTLIMFYSNFNFKKEKYFIVLLLITTLFVSKAFINIYDKIFVENKSLILRKISSKSDLMIFQNSPFFGVGHSEYNKQVPIISNQNFNETFQGSVNSFTNSLAIYGLFFNFFLIISTFQFYIKILDNNYQIIASFFLHLIFINTQGLILSFLFLTIFYYGLHNTLVKFNTLK